jgi:type II secretory pathway pseudopilin PulG
VALVLLAGVVLGAAASSAQLARNTAEAEIRARALQAAEARLSIIRMDSRYAELPTLYATTEDDLEGLPGFTRVTEVVRTLQPGSGNRALDFTRVRVTVSGPSLSSPVSRSLVVGAP